MKEFEKRWEENGGGICGKNACAKYYRYALERILDMKTEDIYGGDIFNKAYHIPAWAVDELEQELEEE